MRPIQTPTSQKISQPTPLPSMAASTANYESLPISRQPPVQSTAALQPNFAGTTTLPEEMGRRADDSRSAITLNPPSEPDLPNIGFDADQLRKFMNQRSLNPMNSGQVLADKKARWDVLNAQSASGHSTAVAASPNPTASTDASGIQIIPGVVERQKPDDVATANNPFRTVGNSRAISASAATLETSESLDSGFFEKATGLDVSEIGLEQPFPTVNEIKSAANTLQSEIEDAATAISPPMDESMLTRLKGLYDPSEDGVARRIWKAQIPKLPNPWSVFRDREEPVAPSPDQFAEAETSEFNFPDTNEPVITEIKPTAASTSLLTQLVAEYENRLANWPKTPAEWIENPNQFRKLQQELRLLYLLQDRPEEAVTAIDLLSPAEQQFFQSLVMSLAEYRKAQASDSPSPHYTGSVHQLRSAVHALSPLADLRIRRLEICSRIHSYGRIETFPSNDFDPGRPLLLYVELENFGTSTTSSGRYLASFDATLQIVEKENGLVKETIRLTDITDESTSARSDYFQSYDLTLPSHLMTGEYEIRLKMRDKFSGKTAEQVVGFQVR